jgi:type VI secretion system secreted protein Hcp
MAFDTFLWIDGLDGDSSDSEHKNWIEITAYNLAATQAVSRTASSTGGATVGRVYLSHFSVVKRVDIATPKILEACCTGHHFKKIVMSVHRAGGEKQKYLKIVFENVIISGINSGNIFDPVASSFPEDVVWFDYAKVNIVYSQQSRTTGVVMGQISGGWNQNRNNTYA